MARQLFSGYQVDLNLVLTEELIDSILDNSDNFTKLQDDLLRIGKVSYERDNQICVFKLEKSVQNAKKQMYIGKMRSYQVDLDKAINALEFDSLYLEGNTEILNNEKKGSLQPLHLKQNTPYHASKSPRMTKKLKTIEDKIPRERPAKQAESITKKRNQVNHDILQQELYQYQYQLEQISQ